MPKRSLFVPALILLAAASGCAAPAVDDFESPSVGEGTVSPAAASPTTPPSTPGTPSPPSPYLSRWRTTANAALDVAIGAAFKPFVASPPVWIASANSAECSYLVGVARWTKDPYVKHASVVVKSEQRPGGPTCARQGFIADSTIAAIGQVAGPETDVPAPQIAIGAVPGSFFIGFTYSAGLVHDRNYRLLRFDVSGNWTGSGGFHPITFSFAGDVLTSGITSISASAIVVSGTKFGIIHGPGGTVEELPPGQPYVDGKHFRVTFDIVTPPATAFPRIDEGW